MKLPYKFRDTPSLKNGKKRKAFALVLALALMGFMVLLVVSLATMVQMQMRLSRQSLNDFKAKQAAKYAAYQAMGQIQSTLGPDQRISANAMIFDDAVTDEITSLEDNAAYDWWVSPLSLTREDVAQINDVALSQNRYWVGVWDSSIGKAPSKQTQNQERNEYVQNTVKQALTWLVSGNGIRGESDKEGTSIKYKPTESLEAGKYVRAVSSGSSTDQYGAASPSTDVLAPIVTLDKDPDPLTGEVRSTGKETRIAWWVSDEGQKASLNAVASKQYFDHAEAIKVRKQSLPFYSGIHGLTLPTGGTGSPVFDLDFDDSEDSSSMNRIRNLDDVKQIDVIRGSSIPESIILSKLFFHDVTFGTKGLLVNVREGGLKKDLSLGLTKKDFSNENPTEKGKTTIPEYFERPYGIGGYDFKTSAYPLIPSDFKDDRKIRSDKRLEGMGHMFGPQMYGHEDLSSGIGFQSASSIAILSQLFDDRFLWKDTGGPLWDQLRSYYNMRAADNEEGMTQVVQTDDRIGLKPVVKRFQVFFVPCFTRYDSDLYGLRLNIVPMMVLWNPYDVKIGGKEKTYYAIRVYSYFKNFIGSFRFAIGYESAGRFQCLRDLFTEFMPWYGDDPLNPGSAIKLHSRGDTSALRAYAFRLAQYGRWDGTLDYEFGTSPITGPNSEATATMMSRKTAFFATTVDAENLGSNVVDNVAYSGYKFFYPLGYGSIAPARFNQEGGFINLTEDSVGTLRSIVSESNLVPNFRDAFAYSGNSNVDMNRSWTARVAKIPLYLNNLLISVAHGSTMSMSKSGGDSYLFYPQREIDSFNPTSAAMTDNNRDTMGGNLHFLAVDETGLEPGEAKLFVMENIVNYLGDPTLKSNQLDARGNNGPNGVIEYRTSSTSPYENKGALMKPYSGGIGCLYLDVPHAETEHQTKYDGTSYRPWWGVNLIPGKNQRKYRYALFDLGLIRNYRNDLIDPQMQHPPTDINQYMIDMEDIVGVNIPHVENLAHTALYATMNMTPIGYGLVTYFPQYLSEQGWVDGIRGGAEGIQKYFAQHRESATYWELELDVWMWDREGFRFAEITNQENITRRSMKPAHAPMIAYMRGYRFSMGEWAHSFPDPSVTMNINATSINEKTNAPYNGHSPGLALTTGGQQMYLAAVPFYKNYKGIREGYLTADGDSGEQVPGAAGRTPQEEYKNFGDDVFDKDGKIKADVAIDNTTGGNTFEFRLRYYLNWLGINSRRHSANSWMLYGRKSTIQTGDLIDAAPRAIKRPLIVEANNNTYMDQLAQDLASESDTDNKVPYGIVFAQSYPKANLGLQGFFNKKMFVNGNVLATAFESDNNAQDMTSGTLKDFANSFGRLQKTAQALTQVWGTNGDGISKLAYKINHRSGNVRVGIDDENGNAYNAPVYHVLRETEVVSNPANLAGAQLSFGAGKYQVTDWNDPPSLGTGRGSPFYRSYGVGYPESLNASFPIGNSLCPSRIVPDRSFQVTWIDGSSKIFYTRGSNYDSGQKDGQREPSWNEDKNTIYDMSWHLNNILWDEYFFSTLPYRNDDYENPVDTEVAMPLNPRIQYCNSSPRALKDSTMIKLDHSSLRDTTEDHYYENAARFWINGPFNVNSTSVDAWKAVLSTFYGNQVEGYDDSTGSTNDRASFHRYAAPYSASNPVTENTSIDEDGTYMKSFRALSADEIEELALSIVEHIKDRGPFYSMSHFVNRVVGNPSAEERYTDALGNNLLPMYKEGDDRRNLSQEYKDNGGTYKIRHMQKGVLQDAIDRTSINRQFHTDPDYIISVDNGRNITELFEDDDRMRLLRDPRDVWENWRGAVGPQIMGAPGYLMQQDILARLGSFLTVRSDTFKIRAYGEVRNPISGIVEGKAWCEMVVQRLPEYIDQTEQDQEAWRISGREVEIGSQNGTNVTIGENKLPLDEIVDELASSDVNKTLGRRFKIVSFKWLNEKEI